MKSRSVEFPTMPNSFMHVLTAGKVLSECGFALQSKTPTIMSEPTLLIIAATVLTVWVFSVGASFGSFLNVIVWRMPLGKPLAMSRSHCPKCDFAIPPKDNLPIIGWLHLKGKCRNCKESISIRYPLVESAVAFLFATLFLLEVVGHGINLPGWYDKHGGNWLTELFHCELLWVFIRHCMLVYFLLAFALIDYDGKQVPIRLTLITIVCCLLLTITVPGSVPFANGDDEFWPKHFAGLSADVQGLVNGMIAGLAIAWTPSRNKDMERGTSIPGNCNFASLTLVGVYLGLEALVAVVWVVLFLTIVSRFIRSGIPNSWPTFTGVVLVLLFWRLIHNLLQSQGWINAMDQPQMPLINAGCAGVVLFALYNHAVAAKPAKEDAFTDSSPDD